MKKSSLVILIVILLISLITGLVIYYNLNKTDSFTKECDAKSTITEKDSCYNSLAYSANNTNLCDKISEETSIKYCKEVIYYTTAINSKDINKCSLIKDSFWNEKCRTEIGEQTLNLNLCKTNYTNCDNGVCEDINTYDIGCITNIGYTKKDLEVCDKISWEDTKDGKLTKAQCYVMLAWKFCDLSICNNKIEEQDAKDYCISRVKIICAIE